MSFSQEDLERLADIPISGSIPPDEVQKALASVPFVQAPTMLNLRDLGLVPGSAVKPGFAFRCGMIPDDEQSKAWVAANVKRIFDLRAASEIRQSPDPVVPGVEAMWVDIDGPPRRPRIDDFARGDGSEGWAETYLQIFEGRASAIRSVLEHVRDRPNEPFLFHCTAGRDRTGVVASILHELAGTPSDAIVFDHRLTRIGVEPQREMLTEKVMAMFGITGTDGLEDHRGYNNFGNLSPMILPNLTNLVTAKYGGLEGYIVNHLGMSPEDVKTIKENLRA